MDITNVNSHDNISRTPCASVSISEDDPYGSTSEDSSSDENSDDECIGRPLLRCPTMSQNKLTYGENGQMYREIGVAL